MLNLIHQFVLTPAYANLRYRTAFTLYSLILILGSIPGARQDIGQVAPGLVLHACAYAGITFLLFTGGSGGLKARALKAVSTVAAMGAVDELVQSFLPYRHGAVGDWIIDVTSAVVTAVVMWCVWKRHKVA
jgi:VanZ family protein